MICGMLDSQDIRNCASCSTEWHSFFGPYRFKSVNITSRDTARIAFLLSNSHHIRGLIIDLGHFDTFVNANCNRLQDLTLGFIYERNEESDSEDDSLNTMEIDGADPTSDSPAHKINKPACAVKLIQGSPSLRAIRLSNDRLESRYDGYYYHNGSSVQYARPVAKPILEAIRNHAFLTKIEVTLNMTCRMLGNLLNRLPRQLQELNVYGDIRPVRNHRLCERQSRLLKYRNPALGLRRLNLKKIPTCFYTRTYIYMLERCPNLEEFTLPAGEYYNDNQDIATRTLQILESNCKRLHTLTCEFHMTVKQVAVFLQGFSKGFRQLKLCHLQMDYQDTEWQNKRFLEALMTTTSFNTIKVLRFNPCGESQEHILWVLKHCPQLRVFGMEEGNYGVVNVELSDLLMSMDEPWKCWNKLEELQLNIVNTRSIHEHHFTKTRRHKTAQDIRELCFRLRSFPKLTTLAITWKLTITWTRRVARPEMALTLDDLNEDAVASGSATMTSEDAAWIGLKLD
ncbi:MAG: hypothetical protein J3Q66DRAFT_325888 [Benniella sp.]|nr:MAG: hypothetical protein J3Q66DRAFT_325888 [Benniella sp.]